MKQFNFILCLTFLLASLSMSAQLTGTFTVGDSTADYLDLNAAATDLETQGIATGGVTLSILPGTYDERVVFENIAGLSSTAPLVISAVPGTVTIAATGTTSTSDATLRFNGMSWVTIENINFTDAGTSTTEVEHAIRFAGVTGFGCSNNTISNVDITMGASGARPGTRTRGIYFTAVGTTPDNANNNNLIDNVRIDNAAWAIQMTASADFFGRLRQVDTGNTISNCSFGSRVALGHDGSSAAIAINALGSSNFTITNNFIASISNLNSSSTLPVSTSGISLDSCSGEISNNIIQSLIYEGVSGSMFGIRSSTLVGETTLIKNNSISGLDRSGLNGVPFIGSTTDPSFAITGIWVFSQGVNNGLAQVLHNSVFLELPRTVSYSTAGVNLVGGSSGGFPATVDNNIIVNNISTSSVDYGSFALADGNTARGFLTSDYNLLFANGTNGYLGVIGRELGGTEEFSNDITTFSTISQTNANGFSFLPELTDPTNFDLSIPASVTDPNSYRVPNSALVLEDILGTTRNNPATFAGAYESSQSLSIETATLNKLNIYPNPASDLIQFGNMNSGMTNGKVRIYSMSGVLVMNKVLSESQTPDATSVDISTLSTGTYIVQLNSDQRTSSAKLIVQ
jgi:hypothetical protein